MEYKHILAALIGKSRRLAFEVEMFCTLYVCTAVLQCSMLFVLNIYSATSAMDISSWHFTEWPDTNIHIVSVAKLIIIASTGSI